MGFAGFTWVLLGLMWVYTLGTWRLVLSMLLPSSMGSNATKCCLLVKPHLVYQELQRNQGLSVPGVPQWT
jgi:hypothetical protein